MWYDEEYVKKQIEYYKKLNRNCEGLQVVWCTQQIELWEFRLNLLKKMENEKTVKIK
jgi:hypothetical protein